MAVALCVDAKYVTGAAVTIASLAGHTPSPLHIWVLHRGLGEPDLNLLRRAAELGGATLHLRTMSQRKIDLPVRSDYISTATFGRLLLAEALPSTLGRVLYLDCDLLVTGDLSELWRADLRGGVLGAVPEATTGVAGTPRTYEHPQDPSLDPADPYFNAGVLLIDLAMWRRKRVGERAIAYVRRNRPPLMDQDALNACLVGRWLPLDRAWNVTTFWFRSSSRQRRYRTLLARAKIVHFVGHRKPWLRPDVWMGQRWHRHLRTLGGKARLALPKLHVELAR
jgi:lipopolysaccharide biosynthesis glycosyltransferase